MERYDHMSIDQLEQRCADLTAQVAALTAELEAAQKELNLALDRPPFVDCICAGCPRKVPQAWASGLCEPCFAEDCEHTDGAKETAAALAAARADLARVKGELRLRADIAVAPRTEHVALLRRQAGEAIAAVERLTAEVARLRIRLAAEEQATRDATALMTQWQEREGRARAEVAALKESLVDLQARASAADNLQDALHEEGWKVLGEQRENAALKERLAEAERLVTMEQSAYRQSFNRAERLEAALREADARAAKAIGEFPRDSDDLHEGLEDVRAIIAAALTPAAKETDSANG